jgi:hypothetical protein
VTNATSVRRVSVSDQIKTAAFGKGFKEARNGKPFRADAYSESGRNQWLYERGRMFGLLYSGPIKDGRRVLRPACEAFMDFYRRGLIL